MTRACVTQETPYVTWTRGEKISRLLYQITVYCGWNMLFGANGQTVTSPPVLFIPGGLRREWTCGRRIDARGGGLGLEGGLATTGGMNGMSVLSEDVGANILGRTTCWCCCADMALRWLPWEVIGWEFKKLGEEVLTSRRKAFSRSLAP